MSAWKKASKTNQKTHRERHQPEFRKSLGLLEKKKDYKLRAKDQNEKKKALKLLHQKALNKNPDEFYHHMINSKLMEDEHHEFEKTDEHSKEQLNLMKTQDLKYIIMKRTVETNKIKRLQSELHMIDAANEVTNKHIFFVDNDAEAKDFNLIDRLDTHPALLHKKTNRLKVADLQNISLPDIPDKELIASAKKRESAYMELRNRIDREKELSLVQQKLETKKALKQKRLLKPKKLQNATKTTAAVYKFKYERKK